MAYEIETVTEGNIDTPLTSFPVGIDNFPRMSDVSLTTLPLVIQYNTYYQAGNFDAANQLVEDNPELAYCIYTAKGHNQIRDAIIAMEYYLLNQVDSVFNQIVEDAKDAFDINDNPTTEQASTVVYSAEKVNKLVAEIRELFSNVENTADADKSVKYAVSAGSADSATTLNGLTATVTELNYVDGVTSNIQTQLNGKQSTLSGGVTSIANTNLTANKALISNANGKVAASDISSTELGYLDGVTGNVQTQLDNKVSAITSRTKNTILAAPDGSDGTPTFRSLVAADIPSLAASKISAGTLAGKVVANASAVSTLSNKQVRNISASTAALTAGTSSLTTGDIYYQYE